MKSFNTISIALLLISLAACTNEPVTIATYNVGAFGKYEQSSIEGVATLLKEIGADAVSLNEVDSVTHRRDECNQPEEFAKAMGNWQINFSRAMPYNGGAYGNVTAVSPNFKVVKTHTLALPKCNGSEPRSLSIIETERFVIASTHLDYLSSDAALTQARTINIYLLKKYWSSKKAVFLCGDFNNGPESETIKYLQKNWTLLSPVENTFSTEKPHCCIDFIFALNNCVMTKVIESGVLQPGDERVKVASDHMPVYVKVSYKPVAWLLE